MDKTTARELNQRLLKNLTDGTTDSADAEVQITADTFFTGERFAQDRSKLFENTPQPVAFSGELPEPGSYLALDVLETPILLTRDQAGKLHAHINACTHRGAPVATGSGQKRTLVCPFHGWTYKLDGSLRGRPEESSFSTDVEHCALPRLAVSEKYGVVVVAPNRSMTQQTVDCALDEIGQELQDCKFEHYRSLGREHYSVNANWKLINDLSLESYHFSNLHRNSVAQMLESNAVVDQWQQHSRWAFPLKSITELAELPEQQWPNDLHGSCTYTLYPGVMLILNTLGAQMIRAEPGTLPGKSNVTYASVFAPGCDEAAAKRASDFGQDVFATEDLPMAEACQRGLAASGQSLPLGRNEPLLQFWHRLWDEAVS